MSFYLPPSSSNRSGNLMGTFRKPLIAAGVGALYNYSRESNSDYNTLSAFVKYGGVVGLSNIVADNVIRMYAPQYGNASVSDLYGMLVSSAATGALNVVGQRFLNFDDRQMHNAVSGAIGAAGANIGDPYVAAFTG